MTVRITFKEDDGSELKMLFGNSYKFWYEQAIEFIFRNYGDKMKGWRYADVEGRVLKVEKSTSKWKGWGGLKWCDEASFQEELNREGVHRDEPDNPNPRQYSNFKFETSSICFNKLMKELEKY